MRAQKEKKTKVFPVRVSPEEHERLLAAAKSRGKPVSRLIREQLLDGSTSRSTDGSTSLSENPGAGAPLAVYHIDDLEDDTLRRDTGALRK